MHLVVLYGYQRADRDPERLALTDQLWDAALGDMAGLWVDLEASWALASGRNPGVTCKQDLGSSLGSRRDFMVGCPRVAAVSGCEVLFLVLVVVAALLKLGKPPHLILRRFFLVLLILIFTFLLLMLLSLSIRLIGVFWIWF